MPAVDLSTESPYYTKPSPSVSPHHPRVSFLQLMFTIVCVLSDSPEQLRYILVSRWSLNGAVYNAVLVSRCRGGSAVSRRLDMDTRWTAHHSLNITICRRLNSTDTLKYTYRFTRWLENDQPDLGLLIRLAGASVGLAHYTKTPDWTWTEPTRPNVSPHSLSPWCKQLYTQAAPSLHLTIKHHVGCRTWVVLKTSFLAAGWPVHAPNKQTRASERDKDLTASTTCT